MTQLHEVSETNSKRELVESLDVAMLHSYSTLAPSSEFLLRSVVPHHLLRVYSASNTTASQQRSRIPKWARPYTKEELKVIEDADRYPPELREQVRAFLEG